MHTCDCEHLQAEVDRYRDEERRRADDEIDRYHRESQERKQRQREKECQADDWDEAFTKGLRRLRSEAAMEAAEIKEYPEEAIKPWFAEQVTKWEAAQRIFEKEWAKAKDELERAQKRIRTKALNEIARLVEFEGEYELAEALRNDDHNYLVYW